MRCFAWAVLAWFFSMLTMVPANAQGEKRVALLIGNQAYNAKVGPLKNPHDDVMLVSAALRSLGFVVTEIRDADYRSMDAAIKRHAAVVRREGQGTISLLYYSGHGAADPDTKTNYLIPVDVAEADDVDLWNVSLNLNNIVEGLRTQAPAATHYVVLDACRNELNLTRKGTKALTEKGFVPIAYTPGVMVAYATAPGRTAADGASGGGPYARVLADELVKPGIEAMTMFRRVALRVNREIGQDPWMSASTLPEVYFAGQPSAAATVTATKMTEAAEAWDRVKGTSNTALLETFVARYKETFYADLARARIEELRKQVASAPASAPAPATPPQPQMAPPLNPSATLNCPAGAGALGVARKVEVDTTGGPGFGSEQYGQHDFLRSKEVVLTFDDGPWPSTTPAVLHALARHCTKAIFFPIGKHALWHPEILREVAARGHTIGGHTWSHANLGAATMNFEKATAEVEKGFSAVKLALGADPAPFFRFPYLKDPKNIVEYLGTRNIAIFSLDLDSYDFKMQTPEEVVNSVMTRLDRKGKGIVLMHDFQQATAKALPTILDGLTARGFKVVHMVSKSSARTIAKYDASVTEEARQKQ
jgi:peptidoglycan/xylan/chitin deacetylase (PgdA/CDA1 family)/uncharacterized caspase-like protein